MCVDPNVGKMRNICSSAHQHMFTVVRTRDTLLYLSIALLSCLSLSIYHSFVLPFSIYLSLFCPAFLFLSISLLSCLSLSIYLSFVLPFSIYISLLSCLSLSFFHLSSLRLAMTFFVFLTFIAALLYISQSLLTLF